MPELSGAATLELWAAGQGLGPVERALALASAAEPALGAEELAGLPIGRVGARLLWLHEALHGRGLQATASCSACGELAAFELDIAALATSAEPAPTDPVELDGYLVRWRSPDSRDLAEAARAGTADGAERILLTGCVTDARGPEGSLEPTALPPRVRRALAEAMSRADPLAEVLVDLTCPSCGSAFVAELDLGSFVWTELGRMAERRLREVDALARAYGWTEREIFALTDRRRAAYLELASEGEP